MIQLNKHLKCSVGAGSKGQQPGSYRQSSEESDISGQPGSYQKVRAEFYPNKMLVIKKQAISTTLTFNIKI